MTYRQLFLKALFANTFFFFSIALNAQVMWNLKGGFMPVNVQHFDDDSEQRVNWMAGLEIEIPTSKKFNIETGLRYKNEMLCFDYSDNYADHMVNHLEVPIRLAYKCKLRDNLAIRAGIGPYLGLGIDEDCFDPKIGIEPSVALDWKCLSLGLTYNHPFYFLDDLDGIKANSGLMLTLGIRFGSNKWKYVGAGLVAASVVASTVYAATQGNNLDNNYSQNSSNYSSYSNDSSNNTSNNSDVSNNKTNGSKTKTAKYNDAAYLRDSKTYDDYDSKLAAMQTLTWPYQNGYNDSDRIRFQREMKRIREKWQNRGYHFTKLPREDWDGK